MKMMVYGPGSCRNGQGDCPFPVLMRAPVRPYLDDDDDDLFRLGDKIPQVPVRVLSIVPVLI